MHGKWKFSMLGTGVCLTEDADFPWGEGGVRHGEVENSATESSVADMQWDK